MHKMGFAKPVVETDIDRTGPGIQCRARSHGDDCAARIALGIDLDHPVRARKVGNEYVAAAKKN